VFAIHCLFFKKVVVLGGRLIEDGSGQTPKQERPESFSNDASRLNGVALHAPPALADLRSCFADIPAFVI